MAGHGELIDPAQRLISLEYSTPGYLNMLRCRGCGHMAGLPITLLVKRFGPQMPMRVALPKLRCAKCDGRDVEAVVMMLCEPGCRRHRT